MCMCVCFYVRQGIVEMVKSVFYGNRSNRVLYGVLFYSVHEGKAHTALYMLKYIVSLLVDSFSPSCVFQIYPYRLWLLVGVRTRTRNNTSKRARRDRPSMSFIACVLFLSLLLLSAFGSKKFIPDMIVKDCACRAVLASACYTVR